MDHGCLPIDEIIQGDCVAVMNAMPEACVDLIFADPPYNLQLRNELHRPNMTRVDAVDEEWDRFSGFDAYDAFTRAWLSACRRVLKPTGTLWVIGAYHCIFRIGAALQDLGYWILNDVIWVKTNPMPNFRGVRFTNAHETLIWAARSPGARYTFNHHAVKAYHGGKQARSDWRLPVCTGQERVRVEGRKAHPTQKPEALLERVIVASSRVGDLVLDPFAGTGTTPAVARRLHRRWIGIELDPCYVAIARERVAATLPEIEELLPADVRDAERKRPRVRFSELVARGLLSPGQPLYFRRDRRRAAHVTTAGGLIFDGVEASIHRTGSRIAGGAPCNGWEHWYYETPDGILRPINDVRERFRSMTCEGKAEAP